LPFYSQSRSPKTSLKTGAIFAGNSRLLSSSVEKYLTPIFGQYLPVIFKYYSQFFVAVSVNPSSALPRVSHPTGINVQIQKEIP
jgi:hypothetical protein